jgi:hypothetical protein
VQGYILGNFGLLYALQHADQVERLLILNTPLATNTKLRPELAAYKTPIAFMRPAKDVGYGWFEQSSAVLSRCKRSRWRRMQPEQLLPSPPVLLNAVKECGCCSVSFSMTFQSACCLSMCNLPSAALCSQSATLLLLLLLGCSDLPTTEAL